AIREAVIAATNAGNKRSDSEAGPEDVDLDGGAGSDRDDCSGADDSPDSPDDDRGVPEERTPDTGDAGDQVGDDGVRVGEQLPDPDLDGAES
ncbi:MAG: hypothetical protein ACYSW8_30365, partial [Planctomycetota bacterium]